MIVFVQASLVSKIRRQEGGSTEFRKWQKNTRQIPITRCIPALTNALAFSATGKVINNIHDCTEIFLQQGCYILNVTVFHDWRMEERGMLFCGKENMISVMLR